LNKAHARWVIYLTLGFALVWMLLPFSIEWRSLRPDIVSLALFYWVLALPHRVGITTAFAVGIAQDLIEGAPLGLSSPGLMLATLLLLLSYQRIRQYDLLQQSLVVLVLLLLSAGIEQWLRNGVNVPVMPLEALVGLLCSTMCWIPVRAILRQSRRYYEVY
jgi:rod shape-determining protein MreD